MVAGNDSNEVLAHFSRDVRHDHMTGLQLHAKLRVRQRFNNITFNSVISDDGEMLTQVRLEMIPGDKRLLKLTLPKAESLKPRKISVGD